MIDIKVGWRKTFKSKGSNNPITIIAYHASDNLLVFACVGILFSCRRSEIERVLHSWYEHSFPDELKEEFKEEYLTGLCAENITTNIPEWVEHTEYKDTLLDIGRNINKCRRAIWLRNVAKGNFYSAYDSLHDRFKRMNANDTGTVLPIFWIEKE